MYDLLLKGGEVIDGVQNIHDRRDVAIKGGKIAAVEKDIAKCEAEKVIPVNGRLVTPGLIDIHCHPGEELMGFGVPADEIGLDSGVSLLCDGGSAGAANFHTMRRFIVEPARTDIFCFLNLAKTGLVIIPEIRNERDIDPEWSKRVVEENRDLIKGIKLRAVQPLAEGIGIKAVEIAKKLAADVKLPFMMHIGETRDRVAKEVMDDFTRAAVKLMEKGDILSHFMTWEAGGLILPDGTVYPEILEAQKRNVILDSCHGFNHFSFTVARYALQQGLLPTVISTDFAVPPHKRVVQSLIVIMSKFLNLGLTIDQVIEMTTINPAKALGEEARWGSLKPGVPANVAIMEIVEGEYLFSDGNGRNSIRGNLLLEPRLVLKDGSEVSCCSRYQVPPVYATLQHWQKDLGKVEESK